MLLIKCVVLNLAERMGLLINPSICFGIGQCHTHAMDPVLYHTSHQEDHAKKEGRK